LEPLAGGVQPRARRLGRALRLTLEEAGGAFVKLGQILSTRPDLLPADVIDELARLQDDVAPAPRDDVDAVLAAELGETPQRVFAEFAADPLAAASIAQVHKATLADGGTVAVKVRRPGIRAVVDRDLEIARQLAAAVEARVSWARDVGVVDLAEGFAAALREEVDFIVEARNTISCREALDHDAIVRIPAVHEALSTDGWMDGVAVRGAEQLIVRAGLDRPALARGLLEAVLRQIMVAGVFHADPHPGNVLVRADGTLAMIDFGSVGRLSSPQQFAMLRALLAMSQRDPRQLRDALLDLSSARSATDEDLLEAALGQFLMQRLADGMRPDPALFADLLRLMLDFGLAFPPAVAAVFRALFTLDGTLTLLDPRFNILDEAKATAAGWIDRLVVPDAAQEVVTQEALSLLPVLRRLPRRIDRIASAAERGDFGVNVRLFADRRDVRVVNDLVNRALLAFISVAVGLISVQLLDGAATRPLDALTLLGYVGLVVSVVLVLRTLVEVLRTDR
jgi:ubiquinone biosynthesis protein